MSVHSALTRSVPGELVERLEVASGPDRQIDREIAKAIDPTIWKRATNWASMPCGAPPETIERDAIRWVPAYTESLDAALALAERVLPGWQKVFGEHDQPGGRGAAWKASLIIPQGGGLETAWGPTPALALCIAILKATTASSVGTQGEARSEQSTPGEGEGL